MLTKHYPFAGKEDEPKWLLTLVFSLLLCIVLYLDHGQLPDSDHGSRGATRGTQNSVNSNLRATSHHDVSRHVSKRVSESPRDLREGLGEVHFGSEECESSRGP